MTFTEPRNQENASVDIDQLWRTPYVCTSSFLKHDPAELLTFAGQSHPIYLLHSSRFHPDWANQSIFASPTCIYQFRASQAEQSIGKSQIVDLHNQSKTAVAFTHDPVKDLKTLMKWPGLWIGYIGYEFGQWVEPRQLRHIPHSCWPVIELGFCPIWHVYQMPQKRWHRVRHTSFSNQRLPWESELENDLIQAKPKHSHVNDKFQSKPEVSPNCSRERFIQNTQSVKDYIAAGDIFQANLSQKFTTRMPCDSSALEYVQRQLASKLFEHAEPWYGSYLNLIGPGMHNYQGCLISSSPELFIKLSTNPDGSRMITTRPIKGTSPNQGDLLTKHQLIASEKDKAELNMIVDLMRNDLGRVATLGSVKVVNQREIETHPTVHHGVATVTGLIKPELDVVDLITATMPGGSITGAPKIRAMEIIDELEMEPRGPYTGITGYFSQHSLNTSINIRQLQITSEQPNQSNVPDECMLNIDFRVGAGIVSDSIPVKEYDETIIKSVAMQRTLLDVLGGP